MDTISTYKQTENNKINKFANKKISPFAVWVARLLVVGGFRGVVSVTASLWSLQRSDEQHCKSHVTLTTAFKLCKQTARRATSKKAVFFLLSWVFDYRAECHACFWRRAINFDSSGVTVFVRNVAWALITFRQSCRRRSWWNLVIAEVCFTALYITLRP